MRKISLDLTAVSLSAFLCFSLDVRAGSTPLDDTPSPFWKKPKVYKQIVEEKSVIVSATHDKRGEKNHLHVTTAGHIAAPMGFVFPQIKTFKNFQKWDDHFREIRHDEKTNRVFIHGEALGYHAQMHIQLKIFEGEKEKIIDWSVYEGSFEGMKGTMRMTEFDKKTTEISMEADLVSNDIPLPPVLMGIGLEGIARIVTTTVRREIVKEYNSK